MELSKEQIIVKLERLINQADPILATAHTYARVPGTYVDEAMFNGWKADALRFLQMLSILGEEDESYMNFKKEVSSDRQTNVKIGVEILKRVKDDIENGIFLIPIS